MIFGIKNDTFLYCLAIATNIPQRLKTGFVVQGHIYYVKTLCDESRLIKGIVHTKNENPVITYSTLK